MKLAHVRNVCLSVSVCIQTYCSTRVTYQELQKREKNIIQQSEVLLVFLLHHNL